jgi:phosphatidate cytidylyltransferase
MNRLDETSERTVHGSAGVADAKREFPLPGIGRRLFYGIAAGAICIGVAAYSGFLILIAAIITSLLALREFFRITRCDQPRTIFPLRRIGYIFATLLLIFTYYRQYTYIELLLVLFITSALVYQMGRFTREKANFLYELAITLLGSLYIGGLLSFILKLWNLGEAYAGTYPMLTRNELNPHGFAFLSILPIAAAWGYDTSAYFSGVLWGKIKLNPAVSPRKSVEGLIGGMTGSGTALVLLGAYAGVVPEPMSYPYLFALGMILGFLCQVGDLCASALKREMAVKDSSTLIPGHGGVFDKIDGLLFCIPATYFIISAFLQYRAG